MALGNAYLDIAERVLLETRRPMTPREILEHAFLRNLMPFHLHGRTQYKTAHARLSEDVSRHLESSRFFRTAPGHFFLRSLKSDPQVPDTYKSIFYAQPRRKELRRDGILAISWRSLSGSQSELDRISIAHIEHCLRDGQYQFSHWRDLQRSQEFTPVYSFVVVHRDKYILSYRCGKFRPQSDPLLGMRSIGFGGAVLSTDVDILYDSFFGIVANGISELVYGLGLPRRLAEDARYGNQVKPRFGMVLVSPKTRLRYLHVVLSYHCPPDFSPTKKALSLNDLRWVFAHNPANNVGQYDQTSRFLFDRDYITEIVGTI